MLTLLDSFNLHGKQLRSTATSVNVIILTKGVSYQFDFIRDSNRIGEYLWMLQCILFPNFSIPTSIRSITGLNRRSFNKISLECTYHLEDFLANSYLAVGTSRSDKDTCTRRCGVQDCSCEKWKFCNGHCYIKLFLAWTNFKLARSRWSKTERQQPLPSGWSETERQQPLRKSLERDRTSTTSTKGAPSPKDIACQYYFTRDSARFSVNAWAYYFAISRFLD